MSPHAPFCDVETALAEIRAGRMIVVVDDEDRENEGDLMVAAEMITPEAVNFMATHARGFICLAITEERAEFLELSEMVSRNTSRGGTAFTVSIDAKGPGISTGISAYDRSQTILAAIDSRTRLEVNSDGTMARLPDLIHFCTKHHLEMVTVADLVQHRCDLESDELWTHLERS